MTKTSSKTVLVLQGGGALGSYQAGAYEALSAAAYEPDWIAGISIGAVNGAIIAGNPPDRRVERLHRFWDLVSSNLLAPPVATDNISRKMFNEASAAMVASVGVPGFFTPRFPPAVLMPPGTISAISVYDTSPLRETLLELVDFDLLNSGKTRFSIGAVHVANGNLKYFDTTMHNITPEHIMASGALPPGFPPIAIDGELYWDGGLVSNTPLQYVLDKCARETSLLVFQLDLFSARGPVPETLIDVAKREKEIRYSSRTRLNTDVALRMQEMRRALDLLETQLPQELRDSAYWQSFADFRSNVSTTIVHLIHRRAAYSTQSNDYEFSRYTINEHWHSGKEDVEHSLSHPRWIDRKPPADGVLVLDLTKDLIPETTPA